VTEGHGAAIDELIVHANGDRRAKPKGQDEADGRYGEGGAGMSSEDAQVRLDADEEEEEDQADVGDEVQIGDRSRREDVVGEVGNATKGCRAEDDAGDDVGDNARLSKAREGDAQDAREGDDDDGLDDKEHDGASPVLLARKLEEFGCIAHLFGSTMVGEACG
jgi:hypothetical protein